MIKIYKYNRNDKGFQAVVNDNTLKGKNREEAIDNWIKDNGTEVTIKDYLSDYWRHSFYKDYSYLVLGKPENCIERLAYAEIEYDCDLSYCTVREHSQEDLIESRTSWDEMKDYADGLYRFIDSLISDVVIGKIIVSQNTWKPSDEQMNTLEQWLKDNQYKGDARYCYSIFESLYQDLKKLKG